MRSLVLLLLVSLTLLAAPTRAANVDMYTCILAPGDTSSIAVLHEFQAIRVWCMGARATSNSFPGLVVYRSVPGGWGKAMRVEKTPKDSGYLPLRRSGPWGSLTGQWNELPIDGSAFTIKNYQASTDTFYIEVVR